MDGGGGVEDEDSNTAEKEQPKDSTENPSDGAEKPSSQLGNLDPKDCNTSNSDNSRTLNLTEKPSQSHQHEDVGGESSDDAIETNNLVIDETPSQSHQHVGQIATRTNNTSTLNPTENPSQQYDHLGAKIDNTSKTTSKTDNPRTQDICEIPTQSHQQLVSHQQLESHLAAYVATPARDALKALIKIKIQEKSKQQSTEEGKTAATTADNSADQAQLLQGTSNASDDAYQGQDFQEDESMEWSHDEDGGSRSCDDSTSPGKDKKVLKKEKHRFAAKRYRHKEIWLRDKLQKDEKELIEANSKQEVRAKALEAIKAECLAELKNLDKNQLCKGLSALAQSVPPGYEDAVVSIKMVLYREIGGQMKELAHFVNPNGDQVVPGQGVSVEGLAARIGVHPQDLVLVPPGAASSSRTCGEPCEKIIITCRPVNDGSTPQSASNKPVIETIPGIIYAGEGTIMVASMKPSPGERVIDASRKDLPQATVSPLHTGYNQVTVPPLFVGSQHNVLPLHAGNHTSEPPLHPGTNTAPLPIAELHTEIQVPVAAPLPVRTEYVTVVPSMNQTSVPPLHAGTHTSTGPLPAGSYGTTPVLHVGNQQAEAPLPMRTEYVMTPSVNQAPRKTSPLSNHTQRERPMPVLEQSAPIDLSKATGLKETKKYDKVDNISDDIQVQEVSQSSNSINTTDELLSSAAMALIDLSNAHALIDLSKTGAMRRLDLAPVQREFAPNTSQALVPEASNTGSMMIQHDYDNSQVYTQQSSINQTDPAQVGLPYSRPDPVILSPPPKQTSPLDLSKSRSQTDSQDPNVQEISTQTTRETSTPVIVFVQSLSSGMGELPRIDLNQTKPVLPVTGNHSEPNIQSSNQVYNQATQQTQYHSIHDPAEQERHNFAHFRTQSADTNSSSSSSSDEEPSTSGHSSEQPHQLGSPVKLLHKSLLSAQRGPVQPLIGITRKERQRYASKKNRQKNQLIKKALLKDEEHLKKANAKLHDIIQDLESIKGHCLAELATTNKHLTGQLRSHSATNQDTQLKPYWDTVRLSMSLLVPHPLSSKFAPMCISANFPFKELRSDNQMWSKPMDPKYLNSVLMNVKLDRLEWNGTLLSPGTVRERHEEKQENDSGRKMEVAEENQKLVVLVKPADEKIEVLVKPDDKMEVEEKPAVPASISDANWLLQLRALQASQEHARQVSPSVEPHGSGEKMEVVEK